MPSKRILIIVENLTVPLDRRVWQEATALRDAGHTVSIICPRGGAHGVGYELLEGIHVHRHPLPVEASGALGYVIEYLVALFWELVLTWRVHRRVGFDVIQACNPPDTIFLVAGLFKLLFGTRFIFDHHDLNPELYEVKFGRRDMLWRALLWLERLTFRTCDVAIATNETFRDIAIERGGMSPDRVVIVRSIPDLSKFRRTEPDPDLRKGREHLVGYIGVMGPQDGVDLLVEAMGHIVGERGRTNVHCAIVGSGTELQRLQALAEARGVTDHITFTGFLPDGEPVLRALSSFDIGVIPDPKNVFNDKVSLNKVFQYSSLGIPFVQFDLEECRKAAGPASLVAENNDPRDLAAKMLTLLDDPELRARMGRLARERAGVQLDWERERAALLQAYEIALAPPDRASPGKAHSVAAT